MLLLIYDCNLTIIQSSEIPIFSGRSTVPLRFATLSLIEIVSGRVVALSTVTIGARCVKAEGKQMNKSKSMRLKGTVIGGSDTPLHKLDIPDVTRVLRYKKKSVKFSYSSI